MKTCVSRSARRWPWLALAALIGALACEPEPFPSRPFYEDFETACDGTPCGWERSDGEASQAIWVESIHPGEHALRLTGEVTVRGPGADPDVPSTFSGTSLAVRVVARCDPGDTLAVDVLAIDASGGRHEMRSVINPESEWTRVATGSATTGSFIDGGRISAVIVRKNGPGVCEIGEIVIDTQADRVSC